MRLDVAADIDVLCRCRVLLDESSLDAPRSGDLRPARGVDDALLDRRWLNERFADAVFPLGLLISDAISREAPRDADVPGEIVLTA